VATAAPHRALFAAAVAAYIRTNLSRSPEDSELPDPLDPRDPVFVVTNPRVPVAIQGKIATLRDLASAESLARKNGRRLAVAEFKLGEASQQPDGKPAVDIIIASGRVVPQPPTPAGVIRWKYVSEGFDAYHVYREGDGPLVFRLEARAAN
jgi:hypothetical protein